MNTLRKPNSLAVTIKRMVFTTSVSVLFIASLSFLILEWFTVRQSLLDRISITSELVAEHLTAAVSFGDTATAERFLNSLHNDGDIEHAAIALEEGELFATYQTQNTPITYNKLADIKRSADQVPYRFTISSLYHWQTITLNKQPIGTLFVKVSLRNYWLHLVTYSAGIFTLMMVLVYILRCVSNRFQQSISTPIDMILNRMSQVQNKSDYSIRMNVTRSDELGKIMYQFNDMVAKIEARDTELLVKNAEIEQHAFYDPLTGLPNRRLLHEQLKHEIQSASRTKHFGAVIYIDLDNFKTINDSLGHDVGDKLLIEIANRMRKSLRESDICSRLGGDEFIAVLPNLGDSPQSAVEHAFSVAEQLRNVFTAPIQVGERSIHTAASIGVSLFDESTDCSQEILKQSDMAMYAAKNSGRNCTHFFSDEMQEEAINRLNVEEELRAALEDPWKYFELFYQPQIDHTGACIGAEGLIRWHHPTQGLVMPGKFISLAETTGLIIPLGNWVIASACKQIAAWQAEGRRLKIAVNVSSNQFLSDGFSDYVKRKLQEYQVDPRLLELEITESLILDDKDKAIAVMTELRNSGITFSIDDFGTGYSSLQYLTALPISKLKIDRSFVQNITTDKNNAAIVKTIILMTQQLGLEVLAEGVEESDEQAFLLDNGCELYQGYLFSKPINTHTFEKQYIAKEQPSSLSTETEQL